MPSQYVDHRDDITADVPWLYAYVFAQVGSAAVVLTGYFTDITGTQQSPLVSLTITTATTLTALYNTLMSITAGQPLLTTNGNFLGFVGTLSGGSVYMGQGGQPGGAINAGQSPAAGYPVVPAGTTLTLGRISQALLNAPGPAVPPTGGVQRVNAGFSAPGQSIKNYTGSVTSSASVNTTVALETVTPGKTYCITDIYLSANTTNQFEARIQANGTDIFRAWCKGDTSPVELTGIESQPNASAGQAVTLLIPPIAGAPAISYFIAGFEQ